MADARQLVAPVPIRCCSPGTDRAPGGICGSVASWVRPRLEPTAAYVCDVHRQPGDMPIAGVALVRRVSVVAEIVFNATLAARSEAENEALTRAQEAIAAAGGAISLHSVSSEIGRQDIPAPPDGESRRRGRVSAGG